MAVAASPGRAMSAAKTTSETRQRVTRTRPIRLRIMLDDTTGLLAVRAGGLHGGRFSFGVGELGGDEVLRETQVFGREVRRGRVAPLDGLEQADVVGHVGRERVVGVVAQQHPGLGRERVEGPHEARAAGERDELLVEADVGVDDGLGDPVLALGGRGQLLERRPEIREVLGRRIEDAPSRTGLDRLARDVDVEPVGQRHHAHERAAMGLVVDQALLDELADGLAHRAAPGAERRRLRDLAQRLAPRGATPDARLAQLAQDLLRHRRPLDARETPRVGQRHGLLRWTVDNHTNLAGCGSRESPGRRSSTVDTQIRPLVGLSTMVGTNAAVTYRSPLRSDANAGRVALVTGGGTGIGRATALELAGSGASVVVCGRREGRVVVWGRGGEPLERTRADVEAAGGACRATAADLREPDEVARVVDAALERFGRVDVLVNNAGGQFTAPAEEISDKGWRAVERLTVDAVWSVTRTVATRAMVPAGEGGLVVFVGFSPLRGIPGFAHASAGRAAVANLATGLALEWSRYGIRSVCVAPGTILTEGLEGYGADQIDAWRRTVPLGRLGRPEEVAALIAFLATAGGAYVTGATIVVDGGVDAWGLGEPPPPPEAPAPCRRRRPPAPFARCSRRSRSRSSAPRTIRSSGATGSRAAPCGPSTAAPCT